MAAALLVGTAGFAQSQALQLIAVAPASGPQGTTLKVTLTGSSFNAASTVHCSGTGVVVQSVRFVSSTSLEATLLLSALPNSYTLSVSNGTSTSNTQTFTILPGSLTLVSELDVRSLGNQTAEETLDDPFQVSVFAGFAYVADYAASVIRKISLASGAITTLAGAEGEFDAIDDIGAAARFGQPSGVWTDGNDVYVADAYFDTIRQISLITGQVTTLAGSSNNPSGSTDGIGANARFRSPHGVWGDGSNLYVSDSFNFTVRKIVTATGEVTTLAGAPGLRGATDGVGSASRFFAPLDLWGDGTYLYVADGSAIRRVTLATRRVETVSGNPLISGYEDAEQGTNALFGFVTGLWGNGANLFVADSGNEVIRRISLETGAVTTVAGMVQTSGYADGPGQAARFNSPSDITGDGKLLYISDRMNSALKLATPLLPAGAASSPSAPTIPSGPAGASSAPSSAPPAPDSGPRTPAILRLPAGNIPGGQVSFQLPDRAGTSQITSGRTANIQTGYGLLLAESGSASPSGMAIFGYRRDGVLVSEASVPVSQLIYDGRIPAQVDGVVNSGLALVNPNVTPAVLNFSFADEFGARLYSGSTEIPAGGQITAFLNEPPFAPLSSLGIDMATARTFTFSSSLPVGVTAIRGFINERSDFLMTTLPVADLSVTDSSPIVFAHYAQGGGWKTELTLINPTDGTVSGVVDFFSQNSQQSLPYSIAPRGSITMPAPGGNLEMTTGWIRVSPHHGMTSPSGLAVFSFKANGVTVTEAGVAALPEATAFRLFVESAGDFINGEPGSIQTGFALSNSRASTVTVNLELFTLRGTSTGLRTSVRIPAHGQVATFLNQLPGFNSLQSPFQGFVRITGSAVNVAGLRGRYNERREFLITTTAPAGESTPPSSISAVPYFVDGGGYTTQFVLFNGGTSPASNGKLALISPTGNAMPLPLQ
jgi:hypothetical protein